VTEIFVRVNSLGAKLRSSDLALAQITAKWPKSLKAVQDTYFTSPTLTAWRDLSLGATSLETTPGLLVATSGGTVGQATTQSAVEVKVLGTTNAKITWDGFITSRDKPVMRFHGRLTSAPTGTLGTDYAAGDPYFNTTNSKFYCHDGISWKPF
jgi:hypothetical protein